MGVKGLTCAITSNGAAAYDVKSGERSFSCPMEEEKVETLLGFLEEEPETAVEVFWDGEPYAGRRFLEDPEKYGAPARAVPYLQRTRTPVEDIFSFIRRHKRELDAVDIICEGPLDKAEWVEKLDEIGGLYVTSSTPCRLEISSERSGKGAALREAAAPAPRTAGGDYRLWQRGKRCGYAVLRRLWRGGGQQPGACEAAGGSRGPRQHGRGRGPGPGGAAGALTLRRQRLS